MAKKIRKAWLDYVLETDPNLAAMSKKDATAHARRMILESRNTVSSDAAWAELWAPPSSAGSSACSSTRPASSAGSKRRAQDAKKDFVITPEQAQQYFDNHDVSEPVAPPAKRHSSADDAASAPASAAVPLQNIKMVPLKAYFLKKRCEKTSVEVEAPVVLGGSEADSSEGMPGELDKDSSEGMPGELDKRPASCGPRGTPSTFLGVPITIPDADSIQAMFAPRAAAAAPVPWTQLAQEDLLAQGVPIEVAQQLVEVASG